VKFDGRLKHLKVCVNWWQIWAFKSVWNLVAWACQRYGKLVAWESQRCV